MEIKTKYSIGQMVSFKKSENDSDFRVATITGIHTDTKENGSTSVSYRANYTTTSYTEYGEAYDETFRLTEEEIIDLVGIDYILL